MLSREERAAGYATELAHLDAKIEFLAARAAAAANDWTLYEALASACLERARFACRLEDFRRAESALARAFEVAEPGSGPFLLRARLNSALHRFDRIESDLASIEKGVLVDAHTRAAIALQHGDLEFQCGRYDSALSNYEKSWSLDPEPETACAFANYHAKLGFDAKAAEWTEVAARRVRGPSPVLRSWLYLQRGLMRLDRGEYDAALDEYSRAGAALPGWCLIEEHIAEAQALLGNTAQALEIYARVEQATGNSEFMAAIAAIHKSAGRIEEASEWALRAGREYDRLLAEHPEAYAAHALEYFLDWDTEPGRALRLAEENFQLRPGAEARILLARAHLKAQRPEDARDVIEVALASPWRTAELHAAAAAVYAALGDDARAEDERRKALERNPHIFDRR